MYIVHTRLRARENYIIIIPTPKRKINNNLEKTL